MQYLKLFWHYFQKAGFLIGDFISGVIMMVFYFTVFAIFALPYRLFASQLKIKQKDSNWIIKEKTPQELKDFQYE